jgi:hypothetical protein
VRVKQAVTKVSDGAAIGNVKTLTDAQVDVVDLDGNHVTQGKEIEVVEIKYVIQSTYTASALLITSPESLTNISRLWKGVVSVRDIGKRIRSLTLYPAFNIFTRRSLRVSSQWTPFRYSLSDHKHRSSDHARTSNRN